MFLVKDDYEAIEKGGFLYDCLYAYCKYARVKNERRNEIEISGPKYLVSHFNPPLKGEDVHYWQSPFVQ